MTSPVWSHRAAGVNVATANVTLLTCPTGRTVIVSRLDLDIDATGAGVIRVSLVTPAGLSLRKLEQTAPPTGPLAAPNLERVVLVPGDILRMTCGAGVTCEWWVSYLLLQGEPA